MLALTLVTGQLGKLGAFSETVCLSQITFLACQQCHKVLINKQKELINTQEIIYHRITHGCKKLHQSQRCILIYIISETFLYRPLLMLSSWHLQWNAEVTCSACCVCFPVHGPISAIQAWGPAHSCAATWSANRCWSTRSVRSNRRRPGRANSSRRPLPCQPPITALKCHPKFCR